MSLRRSVPAYLVLGLIVFGNVSRNPRFASIHTVDVLQLLVAGMCFGLALAVLAVRRRANALKTGA
jgi:hypothetical protein